MRWKWLTNYVGRKIERLTAERDHFEHLKILYPANSFGYKKIELAVAIWDVKIAMWAAGLNR